MRPGDIVMFTDKGTYARWFYGQLAVVVNYTACGADGQAHCRVRWLQPVKYFDRFTSTSDFRCSFFSMSGE
ncbi:hypothetical protein OAA09_01120 [bacterium]|nr:hypothetical protein [bacterium]